MASPKLCLIIDASGRTEFGVIVVHAPSYLTGIARGETAVELARESLRDAAAEVKTKAAFGAVPT